MFYIIILFDKDMLSFEVVFYSHFICEEIDALYISFLLLHHVSPQIEQHKTPIN